MLVFRWFAGARRGSGLGEGAAAGEHDGAQYREPELCAGSAGRRELEAGDVRVRRGTLIDRSGKDESLSELTFDEMCAILADALLLEQYVPTTSVEGTQLLIVVSWGKTMPHDDGMSAMSMDGMSSVMSSVGQIRSDIAQRAATDGTAPQASAAESAQITDLESQMTSMMMMQDMADRARRKANDYNAKLLGYAPALYEAYTSAPIGPQRSLMDSLVEEIETPRYFVILQAYDFQRYLKDKEKVLLWMTRFSIRAKGRNFHEELASMASAASGAFGKEGGKLKRHLRPGRGEVGELEVMGVVEDEDVEE